MNNLDQMTIDDYFAEFSHFHVKKATELLQPLHTPGPDPLPDFSYATRQPFEPQAHLIAAAVRMLDETRRGMLVAEPGSGKTLMGMLTIHQHAQRSVRMGGRNGNYRAIVLCPDHLCKKWKAELEETIPGVKVTMFDVAGKGCKHLISDMTRLYDLMKGPRGRWNRPQGADGIFSAETRRSSYRPAAASGTSDGGSARSSAGSADTARSSRLARHRTARP
jgi:hypothetical protein